MKSRFQLYTAGLAIIIIAGLFAMEQVVATLSIPLAVYGFVIGFALLTAIIHNWLVSTNNKDPKLFVTYFMGALGIRLFATLIFMLVYLYFNQSEKVVFSISIMMVYFSFTVLEISSLYRKMIS
jgi:hypothetical protein